MQVLNDNYYYVLCFRYCNEHALRNHLLTAKYVRGQPPKSAEALLYSLSHYVKKPKSRTVSSSTQYSDEGQDSDDDGVITKSLDPFSMYTYIS